MNQNHFTIAIDCCQQIQWIERCLKTCLTQKYENFEVIVMDAISTDGTFELCKKYEKEFPNLRVYQNEVRLPQVANFVELTKLAKDGSIICSVDGDDWVHNSMVLSKLDKTYGNPSDNLIWTSCGSYTEWRGDDQPLRDVSWHYGPFPQDIIDGKNFREYKWNSSHLRTWKKSLFQKINEDDLKIDGKFLETCGDVCVMLYLLEMASGRNNDGSNRIAFVPEILYVYNVSNVNTNRDSAINLTRQQELEKYIRSKKKYTRLETLD